MSLLPSLFKKASAVTESVPLEQKPTQDAVMSKLHEDPFTRDCIKNVHIFYRKCWSTDTHWTCTGSIEFQKGNTKGEQKFETHTIEDTLEEMAKFIKTL